MLIQLMMKALWAVCERDVCSVERVDSSAVGLAAAGTADVLEHCWKSVIADGHFFLCGVNDTTFC